MKSVIVTTNTNAVYVNEPENTNIVTAYTEGPQGPFPQRLGDIGNVQTGNVTDGSVLYYDSQDSQFKANSTWTTSSLSDGGNF